MEDSHEKNIMIKEDNNSLVDALKEKKVEEPVDVRKSRFRDAPFFNKASTLPVSIGGLGGIGTWLTLYLSRIVPIIYGFDFDDVEEVNLAGQLFSLQDVGLSKANATRKLVTAYGTATFYPVAQMIDKDTEIFEAYIFSAFDNMKARKDLFAIWEKNENRELFIDGRLLADQYEVYFVQKGQEERYRKTLFEDSEVEEVACTFKQTSHFAAICAARMVHGFTNYLSQEMFYKIPFKFAEEGNLFHHDIEF